MTRYEKLAISLPSQAAESVRRAVKRGSAPSVSAYVAAAIEQKTKLDDLDSLLDEMLAETGGPLTDEEKRIADLALGISTPRKGTRPESKRKPLPRAKRNKPAAKVRNAAKTAKAERRS